MCVKGWVAVWFAIACGVGSGVAKADEASAAATLSQIQVDTLLLKAQAERARAQAELDDARSKGEAAASGGDLSSAGVPAVTGVYGAHGVLYAEFLYSNGSTVPGRLGADIPGGYRVDVLSVDRVELVRSGQRFRLGFSGAPSHRPAAAAQSTAGAAGSAATAATAAILASSLPGQE